MHICVVVAAIHIVLAAYQDTFSRGPLGHIVYVCCGAPLAVGYGVLPVVGCAVPSGAFSESKLIFKFIITVRICFYVIPIIPFTTRLTACSAGPLSNELLCSYVAVGGF